MFSHSPSCLGTPKDQVSIRRAAERVKPQGAAGGQGWVWDAGEGEAPGNPSLAGALQAPSHGMNWGSPVTCAEGETPAPRESLKNGTMRGHHRVRKAVLPAPPWQTPLNPLHRMCASAASSNHCTGLTGNSRATGWMKKQTVGTSHSGLTF